jgi:hypothetical protein
MIVTLVRDRKRGHNSYDDPVITVMIREGRERGQNRYDHPVIAVMTGTIVHDREL